MAKNKSKSFEGYTCDCGVCSTCSLILPIVILAITLIPGWYTMSWAKWVIVISALFLLVKRWCPCNGRY